MFFGLRHTYRPWSYWIFMVRSYIFDGTFDFLLGSTHPRAHITSNDTIWTLKTSYHTLCAHIKIEHDSFSVVKLLKIGFVVVLAAGFTMSVTQDPLQNEFVAESQKSVIDAHVRRIFYPWSKVHHRWTLRRISQTVLDPWQPNRARGPPDQFDHDRKIVAPAWPLPEKYRHSMLDQWLTCQSLSGKVNFVV